MIQEFKTDLKAAMDAVTGTGLDLEGILKVQLGDTFPGRTQPAITIDWDGKISPKREPAKVTLSFDFVVVLYVSSLTASTEAVNAIINNLIVRRVGSAYKGLHPFLSRFTTWTDGSGQRWRVSLHDDSVTGAVKSDQAKFASVAAAFTLTVSTWLNPSQY